MPATLGEMKSRYLITGASGYIGYHLAKHAANLGHEVSVLGRARSKFRDLESFGIRTFRTGGNFDEIREAVSNSGATCILHLAGEGKGSHDAKEISSLIQANVTFGTLLIEAAIQAGCKRLISAGTYWEYGNSKPSSKLPSVGHDAALAPNSLYAACKAAFTRIAQYASHYRGLEWKQLVLYDVYGPHDWREKLLPRLIKQALPATTSPTPPTTTHEPGTIGLSSGEQYMDFIHVDDVANAFMHASHLMEEGVEFPTFCGVRSQQLLTLRQAVGLLEDFIGVKFDVHWGKHPYMNTQIFNPHLVPVLPRWQANRKFPEGILE